MKWTKNKVLLLLLAVALLGVTLIWGGRYGASKVKVGSLVYTQTAAESSSLEEKEASGQAQEKSGTFGGSSAEEAGISGIAAAKAQESQGTKKGLSSRSAEASAEGAKTDEEKALQKEAASGEKDPSRLILPGSKDYSEKQGMVINKKTGKDKYLTDPVPEGKPLPVEWQEAAIDTTVEERCTLSVSCRTILNNMDIFNKDKLEVLPKDGIIFAPREVVFYKGESVFNVLQREMKKNKIHMEFVMTPMYNSVYIEGIHNLYEFDTGELSGWMYKVNNWFPNYGASRYQLQEGDVVEWEYTCDLGRDVGGHYAMGGNDDLPESKKKALEERIKAEEEKAKKENATQKNPPKQDQPGPVETKTP